MAAEELVSLRNEAMAAQQQRLDLARFKIVSIAVLGSLAIGASGFTQGSLPYIIGLIPFVAIYIDVISETKKIQFMAIGSFLNTLSKGSVLAKYEHFVEKKRNAFLKNYSYQYSTLIVSAVIALIGLGRLVVHAWMIPAHQPDGVLIAIELVSGCLGVLAAIWLNHKVARKIEAFKDAVADES